jgi:alpha-ribazole phosphatase
VTHLYLIRHGETDWNIEGRWQGQADVPLNARGLQQAAQTAAALTGIGFSAIYSSDLARARQTAEALAHATGVAISFDPRLREIHQGEWQGQLVTDIRARYAQAYQLRLDDPLAFAAPGGETARQVQQRVVQATDDILRQHPCQHVAIVSHGFALAVIWVYYQGLPFERVWQLIQSNAEVRELIL